MKERLAVLKEKFHLRQLLQLLLISAFFFIGAAVVYVNEIEPRKQDAYTVDPISEEGEWGKLLLKDGETVAQDFVYNNNQMIALGVMIYSASSENTGSLHMALTDTVTGELLGETDADLSLYGDMRKYPPKDERIAYLNVGMPTIYENMDQRALTLTLRGEGLGPKTRIYLYTDTPQENILIRGYCYLYNFWETYFRLFAVLLYGMLVISYFLLLIWKAKLQRFVFFAGLILGLTYNFILPPGAAPGEKAGILAVIHAANRISGVAEPSKEETMVRQTDLEALEVLKEVPDLKEYAYIHWNLLRRPASTEPAVYRGERGGGNPIGFVTGLLAVGLGRALSLNGITMIFLGRFFALLTWLLLLSLAIRFLPQGKAAVFAAGLSPALFTVFCSYAPMGRCLFTLFTGGGDIGNGIDINPFWVFFQCALILFGLIPVQRRKSIIFLRENRDPQVVYLSLINAMFFINNILSSTKNMN